MGYWPLLLLLTIRIITGFCALRVKIRIVFYLDVSRVFQTSDYAVSCAGAIPVKPDTTDDRAMDSLLELTRRIHVTPSQSFLPFYLFLFKTSSKSNMLEWTIMKTQ